MALRALILNKKIEAQRSALDDVLKKLEELKAKEDELEQAVNELNAESTQEEKDAVQAEVDQVEAERDDAETKKEEIQAEIATNFSQTVKSRTSCSASASSARMPLPRTARSAAQT